MKQTRKFEFELAYNQYLVTNGQTITDLIAALQEVQNEVGGQHTIESIECRRERNRPLTFVVEIKED